LLSKASAKPPIMGAHGEADVEGGAHERLRVDPLLAREDVEGVGAVPGATGRADELEDDHHREERDEAVDPRPRQVERGLRRRAEHPHPLRAHPVGELAHRHREEERDDAGDGQAEPDLGGRQPHDLGEEHRAAGEEHALADREQDRLQDSWRANGVGGTSEASQRGIRVVTAVILPVRLAFVA
jgi:hypothetical protein